MYAASKNLRHPSHSLQPLWRYFTYERLLDLLESEELFFTHLPVFSDALEGLLTERSRDRLFHWFYERNNDPATAHREVELYEKHQEAFYASCWHMNNAESYLMWKAYGNRGFAVRTTVERAQAAFEPFNGNVTGGVVQYVDFERGETPLGNVFNHVITKDLPYTDEREFRFLLWQYEPANANIAYGTKGVRVQVNLRMLIERVVVSPLLKEAPSELLALLELKQIQCSVGSSRVVHRGAK